MTLRQTITVILAATYFALSHSTACEIRVRDSAFRVARDVHRLYVIAEPTDESAAVACEELRQWLNEIDGDLNLEIERIDASDPEFDWPAIGIPSAPPQLPVTVMVGRDNGNASRFVIDHWEPFPTHEAFMAAADSPIRQRLAEQLARSIAVLIHAPRDPDGRDDRPEALAPALKTSLADERIGVSTIRLDRTDSDEQLLCRFMGIRPDSPDTLCVAFGRGKLMSPPLIGSEITAENINALVTQIRQACSCSKPLSTMGVDLPLVWSDAIDSRIILMDEEIDLSELDSEVQNMLDAKANAQAVSATTEVSIPPGYLPDKASGAVNPPPTRVLLVSLGVGALLVVVLLVALTHLRSRRIDSYVENEC